MKRLIEIIVVAAILIIGGAVTWYPAKHLRPARATSYNEGEQRERLIRAYQEQTKALREQTRALQSIATSLKRKCK